MSFEFPKCPIPQGSTVWIYLRDNGGETQDLASQRTYILDYCKHHQLQLKQLFEDSAVSGGSVNRRDEFGRMVEMARSGRKPLVDGIIYWDIKRFARNQDDSQYYKADLRRRGYKLISISDGIPDNEFSIVFEAFLEWKAQKDRTDISKDCKRGLAFIVGLKDDNGNYVGIMPGRPPTCFKGEKYDIGMVRNNGQRRVVQRLVPDPEMWERGRHAFEMRAERVSYKEIEQACRLFPNAKNLASSYNTFFKNTIYTGVLHYGGQVYENFVPPLTTLDIWHRVQDHFYKKPRRNQSWPADKVHPKSGQTDYLLSGLCHCIFCGNRMHGEKNTRRNRPTAWRFYLCSRKHNGCAESRQISAKRLETAVVENVYAQILTADFLTPLVDRVNEMLDNTDNLRDKLEVARKKSADLTYRISKLLDALEMDSSSGDIFERLQQRRDEHNVAKREVERIQNQLNHPGLRIDERFLKSFLEDARAKLKGEFKVRQFILQKTIEKIEVGRDHARLYCKFPMHFMTLVYSVPPTGFEPVSQP